MIISSFTIFVSPYATQWDLSANVILEKLDLSDSSSYSRQFSFLFVLQWMFSLLPSSPSASNPCEENDGRGPCSHLCLINYNRSVSCTCPHLMKLSANKQSCFGKWEHITHFSYFFLMLWEEKQDFWGATRKTFFKVLFHFFLEATFIYAINIVLSIRTKIKDKKVVHLTWLIASFSHQH